MDLKSLKAEGYELVVLINQAQARLQQIQRQIANFKEPEKKEKKKK